jgi:hypothetical protein
MNNKQEHKPYVTVGQGMRGYYAVMVAWNSKEDMYEPLVTSDYDSQDREEAALYAKDWAAMEGVEFRDVKSTVAKTEPRCPTCGHKLTHGYCKCDNDYID